MQSGNVLCAVQWHAMLCCAVLYIVRMGCLQTAIYHTMAFQNPAGGTDHSCCLCFAAVNQGVMYLALPSMLH